MKLALPDEWDADLRKLALSKGYASPTAYIRRLVGAAIDKPIPKARHRSHVKRERQWETPSAPAEQKFGRWGRPLDDEDRL